MQTAELVMEQTSKPMIEPALAPTGIKTILFHVHNDDRFDDRLQVALSLARAFGAHLHLLHVTPIEAYTVTDAFATYVNPSIVEVLEDEAAKLRGKLEQQLAKEDVSWDYEDITSSLMPYLVQRAALADLVVMGRQPHDREFGSSAITLLGEMLYRIRTPLLIAGDEASEIDPFGPAVVAWNGSYEAANAVRNAVGLLKLSSNVRVVRLIDGEQPVPTLLLEYLSRHGIHAQLDDWMLDHDRAPELLTEYAKQKAASYIVMGGYGHTRAGEFLFGGVTRSLLKKCPISLVVAH